MFGAVDALLFRPLHVPQTSRIVRITSVTRDIPLGAISYPDFDDLLKRLTVFEGFATAQEVGAAVSTQNDGSSRITFGLVVNADFLRTLRLQPVMGRSFQPEEDAVPGRDAVAMISYAMWQRDFAGKPDVIGKTMRVITTDFRIIGVVPSAFTGLNPLLHPEFYVPHMMAEALADPGVHPLTDRSVRMAAVFGRLKPGVSIGQASAEATRISAQLEQENPATNRGQSMTAYTQVGFRIAEDPGDFKAALLFLLIGALVLGIACVNVGNLLLSLAPARVRETAVRFAMGARRGQLIRQFLIESCVISAAATAAGLSIAALVARFIRSVEIGNGFVPITIEMQADARVALFAFTVGVGSGILSALIPAFRCSRGNLSVLMRSADPRVARTRTRFRELLVGAQVALATIVLVLSGLALQSFALLTKADPGFRFDHVLAAAFDATMGRGVSIAQAHRFYARLLERVRNMPGVESAGLGHHVPLGMLGSSIDVVVEGYSMPEGQHSIRLPSTIVGDGYFDTLRIPLLRGRAFNFHDTPGAPKVVIINEAMAEKFWPGRNAIGAHVEIRTPKPEMAEVIGIARNGKYRSFNEQSWPFIYRPLAQTEESFIWIFVATKDDPATFIPVLRNVVREIDPAEPMYDVRTMADVVRRQALWSDRLTAQIATSVGVAGLLLGVLGLYGMLAYSVSRRTREIGIRMALGATSRRVYRMIVFQGLRLSIGGMCAGLILARAVAAAIPDVLRPADPQDPIVYGSVVAVLLAVTLLASYHPARRAGRVDPNDSLRSE
jgi:predicted permease